ncbi:MAG: glycoside hydrolase family 130 protein [Candidatus Hermodarchaeia archaeon]|jgi:predicted GH43/DUF377 family glycosyl hydrolase
MKLQRHPNNPLLIPDPSSPWEALSIFNPSVVFHNNIFHMHYRAQGHDLISRIGYAVSLDGVNWNRSPEPILKPENDRELGGVEDPRVTEIDGIFYMAYTAYSGGTQLDEALTPMFAKSDDLLAWERIGPLVKGEHNKDHFLLPKKLNNCFVAFHRRWPDIWIAESEDLINWPEEGMKLVMSPRPGSEWDGKSIGGNGPPIETEHGWLTFYHGYAEEQIYRLGVALLDLEDPVREINRPRDWILEPKERWELEGNVPNVVFSCANILAGDQVWIYYGGTDHAIGLATCDLDEIVDFARFG